MEQKCCLCAVLLPNGMTALYSFRKRKRKRQHKTRRGIAQRWRAFTTRVTSHTTNCQYVSRASKFSLRREPASGQMYNVVSADTTLDRCALSVSSVCSPRLISCAQHPYLQSKQRDGPRAPGVSTRKKKGK